LKGKRIRLTGPEAFSFPEAAKRITKATGTPVRFIEIPLFLIKTALIITRPFNPFIRYVYWSFKLLNNFPKDLAENVPIDYQFLLDTFDYSPTPFGVEIQKRLMNTES
jgi:uncharacterized protein YbjT (DUF2867 family)